MIFSSHGNYLYICSVQSECQGVKKMLHDKNNAPDGIGNYNPGVAYPNQADINSMIKNANLKKEIIDE